MTGFPVPNFLKCHTTLDLPNNNSYGVLFTVLWRCVLYLLNTHVSVDIQEDDFSLIYVILMYKNIVGYASLLDQLSHEDCEVRENVMEMI